MRPKSVGNILGLNNMGLACLNLAHFLPTSPVGSKRDLGRRNDVVYVLPKSTFVSSRKQLYIADLTSLGRDSVICYYVIFNVCQLKFHFHLVMERSLS